MRPLEPCQFMSAKGLVHDVLLDYFPDLYINTLSPNCLCSETSAVKHRVHTALLWELQLYFLSLTYLGQYFYLLTVLCAYWRKGALYSVHPIYAHLPHLYVQIPTLCTQYKDVVLWNERSAEVHGYITLLWAPFPSASGSSTELFPDNCVSEHFILEWISRSCLGRPQVTNMFPQYLQE